MAAERGGWGGLTGLQKLAVILGVPAGATALYILYRRYRESREERLNFVGEEEMEVEVRVPRAAMKSIIGRRGATIRGLRQETGARIEVEEEEEEGEETLLLISGSPGAVCRAKAAVHRIVAENLPVSEELRVPPRAVGRIIGRGGHTVRGIRRSSGARVLCEPQPGVGAAPLGLIQLWGTRQEVAEAKRLILEKLSEDEGLGAARGPPEPPLGKGWEGESPKDREVTWGDSPGPPPEEEEEETEPDPAVPKFEVPSPDWSFPPEEPLEVRVSARQSPARFWVQVLGQRSLHLQQLTREMRIHYGTGDPGVAPPTLCPGDIVAAPGGEPGAWYRARVLSRNRGGGVQLHYVDSGAEDEVPGEALRALRSDFLSLPFQAMECSLAGLAPTGSGWAPAALEAFDRLTRWPLVAKISRYTPQPTVRLLGENVDVGEELVRLGYAVPCPEEDPPVPVPGEAAPGSPGMRLTQFPINPRNQSSPDGTDTGKEERGSR
ncbi:tudor and KH domain-containing protein [Phaethornis superciliosus]